MGGSQISEPNIDLNFCNRVLSSLMPLLQPLAWV